jgi:hypothetical protein
MVLGHLDAMAGTPALLRAVGLLGLSEGILPQEGCQTPQKAGFIRVSEGDLHLSAFDGDMAIDGCRSFWEGRNNGLCGVSLGHCTVDTSYQPSGKQVFAVAVWSPVLGIWAGAGTIDRVGEFVRGLALDFNLTRG